MLGKIVFFSFLDVTRARLTNYERATQPEANVGFESTVHRVW